MSIQISEGRIQDFLFSLLKILQSPAPRGKRGNHEFARYFDNLDELEFLCLKYALIQYFFSEEQIDTVLSKKYFESADKILQKKAENNSETDIKQVMTRVDHYVEYFKKIFGKDRFEETSDLETELYKIVYRNLFTCQFQEWSEEKIADWLNQHEQETQIIPHFIVWFHEAFLTLLTIYDESLWAADSSSEFAQKVTTKSMR
jgi:hypothetical protein